MERFVLVIAYKGTPVTLKTAKDLIGRERYRLALHVPERFSEQMRSGHNDPKPGAPLVSLIVDPTLNMQLLSSIRGTIQCAVERHILLSRPGRLEGLFSDTGADRPGPEPPCSSSP